MLYYPNTLVLAPNNKPIRFSTNEGLSNITDCMMQFALWENLGFKLLTTWIEEYDPESGKITNTNLMVYVDGVGNIMNLNGDRY